MNSDIKEYTTSSGKKRFKFALYVGKDETTGNSIQIRKRGFKSLSEAMREYNAVDQKIRSGEYNPLQNSRYRVKDFYKIWFSNYRKTVKRATASTIARIFRIHILKALGNVYLDRLSVVRCQKTVNEWSSKQGKKLFVLNTVYLKKFLRYAVMIGVIPFNPMDKVIKPRIANTKKEFTNFYSKEELSQFLNDAKKINRPKVYTIFRVLAYSGMRVGELLALKWSDVDFSNNTIDINKTVSMVNSKETIDTPKTVNSFRKLSMDVKTMNILKEWRFQQRRDLFRLGFNPFNKDQFVFTGINNQILSEEAVIRWDSEICKKFTLRYITPH